MKLQGKILILIFIFSAISLSNLRAQNVDADINQLWIECQLKGVIPYNIFNTAVLGYRRTENIKRKNLITIIDFSRPSTEERLLVIDLENKKVRYKCFVAHGKNSGENYAKSFSNQDESLMSSLGFYLTGETYTGENGYSLRLNGLEKGINDHARAREIVIHGAAYVSKEFIDKYGRLGRSWGCPALPPEVTKEIIDLISGGSCLFIYADDVFYKENSTFLTRK
jgi:hypothetical protein